MTDRITYVQQKLFALVEACQLLRTHASLYKLAVGQSVPTFKAISYLVPYFAPVEWLFFMDEEIPYPIRTLPEWNTDDTSVFIQQHKKDWKQTAQKYGIEEKNARNIFVNRRANFTLLQMWRMVGEMKPEVWFCKVMPCL